MSKRYTVRPYQASVTVTVPLGRFRQMPIRKTCPSRELYPRLAGVPQPLVHGRKIAETTAYLMWVGPNRALDRWRELLALDKSGGIITG